MNLFSVSPENSPEVFSISLENGIRLESCATINLLGDSIGDDEDANKLLSRIQFCIFYSSLLELIISYRIRFWELCISYDNCLSEYAVGDIGKFEAGDMGKGFNDDCIVCVYV